MATWEELKNRFWELQEQDLDAYVTRLDSLLDILTEDQMEDLVATMEEAQAEYDAETKAAEELERRPRP